MADSRTPGAVQWWEDIARACKMPAHEIRALVVEMAESEDADAPHAPPVGVVTLVARTDEDAPCACHRLVYRVTRACTHGMAQQHALNVMRVRARCSCASFVYYLTFECMDEFDIDDFVLSNTRWAALAASTPPTAVSESRNAAAWRRMVAPIIEGFDAPLTDEQATRCDAAAGLLEWARTALFGLGDQCAEGRACAGATASFAKWRLLSSDARAATVAQCIELMACTVSRAMRRTMAHVPTDITSTLHYTCNINALLHVDAECFFGLMEACFALHGTAPSGGYVRLRSETLDAIGKENTRCLVAYSPAGKAVPATLAPASPRMAAAEAHEEDEANRPADDGRHLIEGGYGRL
jgi:hypothetical protein